MSNHNLSLVLQLISSWDFRPIEAPVDIYADDIKLPYTMKAGGYRVIIKELPSVFTLSLSSRTFFTLRMQIGKIPADKIIPFELIPCYPPHEEAAWLTITEPTPEVKIALGFDYFRLSTKIRTGDTSLSIKNPSRISMEGRRFLLRDTKNGGEEFIILGAAHDALFGTYTVDEIKHDYSEFSVLLPSFTAFNQIEPIPIRLPPQSGNARKTYPVWVYSPEAVRLEISCGDRLQI